MEGVYFADEEKGEERGHDTLPFTIRGVLAAATITNNIGNDQTVFIIVSLSSPDAD